MTSELRVDNLKGSTAGGSISVLGEGTSATTNLQQGLCKCWCQFDGSGTIAIDNSFNTSSLTDVGTGDYTVNITNTLSPGTGPFFCNANQPHSQDSSSDNAGVIRLFMRNSSHSAVDTERVHTGKFGDLA